MLTVVFDSVKRTRGKDEYRMVPRASALGREVVGDGDILSRLLNDLIAAGETTRDEFIDCLRDGKSVFTKTTRVGNFVTDPDRAPAWKPWEARRKKAA